MNNLHDDTHVGHHNISSGDPTFCEYSLWLCPCTARSLLLKCSFVVVREVRWEFGLTPLAALKIGYKSLASFFCESC